jgi:uncharacterized protein YchJ
VLFAGDPRGITILSEPNSPLALRKKLLPLARIAKYRSKADAWLALGCVATSIRLVDAIAFVRFDWKYDPELEQSATHLQGKIMTPSGGTIGRNQPCPCGNGKKLKHSHGR